MAVTITVIGVAVITFVILFIAIFAGLWLDKLLNTRPIITITLVIISIPVTILLMFRPGEGSPPPDKIDKSKDFTK